MAGFFCSLVIPGFPCFCHGVSGRLLSRVVEVLQALLTGFDVEDVAESVAVAVPLEVAPLIEARFGVVLLVVGSAAGTDMAERSGLGS